jgi:signal transduction histidine kinase
MRRGMKQRIEERDQAFEENRRIESEKMKTESALAVSVEHLIRTEKRLQAELLRAEIAANLHDDIGATLSSTSIFSELLGKELADLSPRAAKLLARIKDNLHSVQLSLHDIVWSINPDNDELENILLKLQEDASDILDASGIGLHIDIAPIRGSITVPMEARKELLLIVKEAFNNIVRHAHAHEVTFTATIAEGFMRLTIGDDGCGFAADQRSDGNGLRNM